MLSSTDSTAGARERQGLWLMLAGGGLLGTLGVFLREAGQGPLAAVWFRCVFGLLALTAWMAATRRWPELRLPRRQLVAVLAAGVLMLLNWTLFFAAIERLSISVATLVFHVQPFWVMLYGAWRWGERVTPLQWVATAVALLGLACSSGLGGASLASGGALLGLLMCLGGSFSYAGVTLIAKRCAGVGSLAMAWYQCAVGAVLMLWWPLSQGLPAAGPAWAWLVGLGVVHTGIAYVVLYAGVARLPAGRVAVLQFVYPATALLVDWVVYGHRLQPLQWLGAAMMALALLVAVRGSAAVHPGGRCASSGSTGAAVAARRPGPAAAR
ncbi:MAG: DMT family transporter [Rubrivivax sp.]